METLVFTDSSTKIGWTARILRSGDAYGLNNCLLWDSDKPGVEFYDRRYPHTALGQFVTRYYVDTLLGRDEWGSDIRKGPGLSMQSDIPDWSLNSKSCRVVGDWLEKFCPESKEEKVNEY